MHYFAHTLKGCGPVALALVLTACGEETTRTSAAASDLNLEATESIILDAIGQHTLTQRTVVTEVSSPAAGTHASMPSTNNASGNTSGVNDVNKVSVIAGTRNTSAPVAPVRGNLDKIELANGGAIITAPVQNTKPVQEPITRPPGDREYQDELPEQPPVDYADNGEGSSEQPIDAPIDPPTAAPEEPTPILGADPLVTLIAKTDSDLNSSGTRLVWTAENVDSCTASGAWDGNIAANGQLDLEHSEAGDQTYMIMCNGPSGTAMAMVTITVESTELAWEAPVQNTNGTQLTDLAGYNLYYGTESGRYTQVRPVRDASQTDMVLPVEPGTYYLAMTAYDLSGNESDLSNEIIRIVD